MEEIWSQRGGSARKTLKQRINKGIQVKTVVLVVGILERKGPERDGNGLWPHAHCMREHCTSNISKSTNVAFDDAILVVRTGTTETDCQPVGRTVVLKKRV